MLKGLWFLVSLLSFFLYIGLTEASFTESEKALFERSLLIMLVWWELITLADSFTIFTGILSDPVTFLGFKPLVILLICPILAALILKSLLSFGMCFP